MERYKIAPTYDAQWLEIERPQPLSDTKIESVIQNILDGRLGMDISDQVYTDFKKETTNWIFNSKLNSLAGFDSFNRLDITLGCTQFIDTVYMKGPVQIIKGDYRYHQRLNPDITYSVPGYLFPNKPLIIAMPFPSTGDVHPQMKEILDECLDKNIPAHIDGAWTTCCRDVHMDVDHPAVRSVAISLSKGLGLGWNRVGLRWTKETAPDAITIMNDFRMNLRAVSMIGLHFVRNFPSDYLWTTYGDAYYKVCSDFDLTPTKSIHLALRNGQAVGISPLIRYVAQHQQ
jgi:hypothetical protein